MADKVCIGLQIAYIVQKFTRWPKDNIRTKNATIRHGGENKHHPQRKQPDNSQRCQPHMQPYLSPFISMCSCTHLSPLPNQRLTREIITAKAAME